MAIHLKRDREVMAEINITPLTDVLLVLLIIFMVTATTITQTGFDIKLPTSASQETTPPKPIEISISQDHQIHVGQELVARDTLVAYLAKLSAGQKETHVVVDADRSLPYGAVIEVMDAARKAGLSSIGLTTTRATP